jgi:site-specific DNA-cytosine methylase
MDCPQEEDNGLQAMPDLCVGGPGEDLVDNAPTDWTKDVRGRLRYFTPLEAARIMGFPPEFSFPGSHFLSTTKIVSVHDQTKIIFPDGMSNRKQYGLIGNSLHVGVVSLLLRYLCSGYFYHESDGDEGKAHACNCNLRDTSKNEVE